MLEPRNMKRMLSSFLKSEPSLRFEENCSSSDESFMMKREPASSGFLLGSPGRFAPASPYAMSPWNNGSPSPEALSPWQSPLISPFPDGRSYACIATRVRQDGHVYALAISSGGLLYTGSESQNIRIWKQPDLCENAGCLRSSTGSVKAIGTVGDRVFSAHSDHKIRIWRRGKRMGTLPTVKDQLQNSVNPNNFVRVRRHHKALWIKHVDVISSLAVNEEQGVLYSGSWDKTVKVWRMSDWKCVESIQAHHDAVNCLAVGAGGFLFTGSADCRVKVWRRFKGKHVLIQTLGLQQFAVNGIAVSPDGEILYAGSADGIVNYWEREKNSSFFRHDGSLVGHRFAILCVATVSNLVISGSADKSLRVWRRDHVGNLHTCLAVLEGHGGPVKSIAATFDALSGFACVYSGSLDRSVKVWRIQCDNVGPQKSNPVLSPAWVLQKLGHWEPLVIDGFFCICDIKCSSKSWFDENERNLLWKCLKISAIE